MTTKSKTRGPEGSGLQTREREDRTLAGRIKLAMASAGVKNPAALARRMKIHRQTVNKWVNGKTDNLTTEMLFSLSDALNCNPRWLAYGHPYSPQKLVQLDLESAEVLQIFEALKRGDMEAKDQWVSNGRKLVSLLTKPSPANPFSISRK